MSKCLFPRTFLWNIRKLGFVESLIMWDKGNMVANAYLGKYNENHGRPLHVAWLIKCPDHILSTVIDITINLVSLSNLGMKRCVMIQSRSLRYRLIVVYSYPYSNCSTFTHIKKTLLDQSCAAVGRVTNIISSWWHAFEMFMIYDIYFR